MAAGHEDLKPAIDEYFLGDLVSVIHGDCSVVAANANQAVQDLLSNKKYVVEGGNPHQPFDVLHKRTHLYAVEASMPMDQTLVDYMLTPQTFKINGEEVRLAIIRPYLETYKDEIVLPDRVANQPAPETTKNLRHFLGKKASKHSTIKDCDEQEVEVEIVHTPIEKELPPQVVAVFGKDLYVPLASFDYRENTGGCSYIQVGAEISDDNFVVTPTDEAGPRHEVVQALRGALQGKVYNRSQSEYAAIEGVINAEITRRQDVWFAARAAEFARRSHEALSRNAEKKQLLILDDSNEKITNKMYLTKSVGLPIYLDSGRRVECTLAQDPDVNTIYFGVMTRSSAMLPILKITPETGEVGFSDTNSDETKLVDCAILLQWYEKPLKNHVIPEHLKQSMRSEAGHREQVISWFLFEHGFITHNERAALTPTWDNNYVRSGKDPSLTAAGLQLWNHLDEYLKQLPILEDDTSKASPRLAAALHRLSARQRITTDLLNGFDLDRRLDEAIGTTTVVQERLFEKVVSIYERGGAQQALLRDVPLSTGSRGDVDMKLEVSLSGSKGKLQLLGLPAGQPEQLRAPYITLIFDTALPIFAAHPAAERSGNPDAYAANLLHILQKISPPVSFPVAND